MYHVTKTKGDVGLAKVMADLAEKGFGIAILLSEHLPYDCIAIEDGGKLLRVSVKYSSLSEGTIKAAVTTGSSKKAKPFNSAEVDVVAIYCPETGHCYYVPAELLHGRSTIWLRVDEPKLRRDNINYAEDFRSMPS